MYRPFLGVLVAALILGSVALAQQPQSQSGPTTVAGRLITPDVLTGTWDYNDALSVDAATGRPERAPRSATQRAAGTQPVSPPASPRTGNGGSGGSGGPPRSSNGGGGSSSDPAPRDNFDDARRAMAAVIAAERRTYVRDLLEVPEQLTIRASADEVTFVDDLSRQQSYGTNGRTQKYQLSAARYTARGTWSERYFRKEIEGANNFKMSETYFVSEDGSRLFVIIRIGDPKRPETLAGVNRVYDRVVSSR